MRARRRPIAIATALGGIVLGQAACSDMFTVEVPTTGPLLTGEIGVASARPDLDCDAMRVEVGIAYDPVDNVYPGGGQTPVGTLAGRAFADTNGLNTFERAVPGMQPFWIEGDIYENGVAVVTLFRSTILPHGPINSTGVKPFSVFRGTLLDNRLEAAEQPPSCGRMLVADLTGGTSLPAGPPADVPATTAGNTIAAGPATVAPPESTHPTATWRAP